MNYFSNLKNNLKKSLENFSSNVDFLLLVSDSGLTGSC